MSMPPIDWLELVVRWGHIITGIAWIGSSFLFNFMDLSLRPAEKMPKGVSGELWMVHGGGFYHLRKYMVAPESLPATLHWFKWEAYWTWITGVSLLVLVYFMQAEVYLIAPGSGLSPARAVAIAVAVLILGWMAYDGFCQMLEGRSDLALGLLVFAMTAFAAYAMAQVFSGRGAFIMVGAMLGTIMVANVFRVIIPNQRRVVAAMLEGRTPDPMLGRRGKQRSLHNNYITLPVLFTMISNHYPVTFAPAWNWLILAALGAIGIAVRHYFNVRHKHDGGGRREALLLPAAVLALIALAFIATPGRAPVAEGAAAAPASVPFADAAAIIHARCTPCHAAHPTLEGFAEAPKGVVFDTPADIIRQAALIHAQTVATDVMPAGNVTGMTPEERAILGRWIDEGAGGD
jgi:uncharacterized membrane protein